MTGSRFLLAALLPAVAVAAVAAAQAVAAPPGRLTFTDPVVGFSIDYPAGWVPRLAADNAEYLQTRGSARRVSPAAEQVALRSVGFFGPGSQMVFVDVWRNRDDLSAAAWLARYPPPGAATLISRTVTFKGAPAVRLESDPRRAGPGVPRQVRIQFNRGGWMVAVEYAALEPDLSLYEMMLASFVSPAPAGAPGHGRQSTMESPSTDLPPAEFGVMVATCCGLTDPEYNPFPCNTAGDASCPAPPCGNCTWWVRYRRTGDAAANLVRCTGDALTWEACAAQYYPQFLSDLPGRGAVVLYPGVDHLSFVEAMGTGASYSGSDLSWYASCPARYFAASAGGGKRYISLFDQTVPNQPPNPPLPSTPVNGGWLAARPVTFTWADGGDPDDGPAPARDFMVLVEDDSGWSAHSGWLEQMDWQTTLPADGRYYWRVKAHDGMLESAWSEKRQLRVDSRPPKITLSTAAQKKRWYNTGRAFNWTVADPAPGSGVDYFKWAWDDPTPGLKVSGDRGAANLKAAGQGKHTLYLQAWDKLGHKSAVMGWGWVGYDTVSPAVTLQFGSPPPNRWYSTPRTAIWSVVDPAPGSGGAASIWDWDSAAPGSLLSGDAGSAAMPHTQGKHTLLAQGRDAAGNTGPVTNLGWFGYDSLIPGPPAISVDCNAPNNRPQNSCRTPVFTWSAADANASRAAGVVEYAYGWGVTTTVGVGGWGSETGFSPGPVAPGGGQARYYLHVQARDAAGNVSAPATFGLWYNGSLPTATVVSSPTETFGVSINGDALYTNVPTVTVVAAAPNVTLAQVGRSAQPPGGNWHPVPLTASHVLSATADYFTPRRIFGWFKDAAGTLYGPYFDDILLDPLPPRGRVRIAGAGETFVKLALFASDADSGLDGMRLGTWRTVTQTVWQAYTTTVTVAPAGPVLYAQFRDRAGNLSPLYGTDGSDSSLTERMYLPLIRRN
ncbi:MAG: hypothetical protein ACE5G8_01495 [Anaerolineae bacterium]